MIQNLDIQNFGIYKNFEWKKGVGNFDGSNFGDLNIIYGRNYSGKTTLSRLFSCIEHKTLHQDYLDGEFEINISEGKKITQNNIHEVDNSFKMRVYNQDFCKNNLSWLHNSDGHISPFTVLGKENNLIEEQVREINQLLGSIEEEKGILFKESVVLKEFNDIKKAKEEKNKSLEGNLRNKARNIKLNTTDYNLPIYDITKIKVDISKILSENNLELTEEQVVDKRKELKEEEKKKIIFQDIFLDEFEKSLEDTNNLLVKKITISEAISELLSDNLLQVWIKKGIEIHQNDKSTCKFCGNPIDPSLWTKFELHFNKESEELKQDITQQIQNLYSIEQKIEKFNDYNKNNFYLTFQAEYENLNKKITKIKDRYIDNLKQMKKKLQNREGDIFNSVSAIEIENLDSKLNEEYNNLKILIKKNNIKTSELEVEKNKIREELKNHEISRFLKEINYIEKKNKIAELDNKLSVKKNEKGSVIKKVTDKREEIKQLERQLKDETKGAELVNKHLSKHFGHTNLELVPIEENGIIVKFGIERQGVEAKNLSEGECSLISFCYFIARIEDELKHESAKVNLMIYIDDPISSLDSNHIFFVFSLIEEVITKPKNYSQIFISTHNLDFLKYLKRVVPKNVRRDFIIERKKKKEETVSFLLEMPKHIKDYITEFNYLFNEIYSLTEEVRGDKKEKYINTYNSLYNAPNNMRKFLECYLFYKYPNSDTPLKNLEKLFDNNIPILLNRVINEYSHLVFIERGWQPVDFEEIENCAKIIIEKIKEKDEEQFNALVSSIK